MYMTGLKEKTKLNTVSFYHIEPGDGTRYQIFVWPPPQSFQLNGTDQALVTGFETRFETYIYQKASVIDYLSRHESWSYDADTTLRAVSSDSLFEPLLKYMAEHSQANLWTCCAVIMALEDYWELGS